jgi:diguanylate cyclase (GGDEF)-like protein
MLANNTPIFLLASAEPSFLTAVEPALSAHGERVEIVLDAEAALAAMVAPHPPTLALLDVNLPGIQLEQLLVAAHTGATGRRFPIVLIADTVNQEWINRLAEGFIDDLISRNIDPSFLLFRLESIMRAHRKARELDLLREAAALNSQMDHLTGIFNRETLLSALFRETDRVQRMKSSLCMILFDIDDFGHWNERLGTSLCDELLCQMVARSTRLLRSYDLFGRVGKDEFLMALPGCSTVNAVLLAERLRTDVFATPFRVNGESIRLSACFGVAASLGRSPVVVLREAEQELLQAKAEGPDTIRTASEDLPPSAESVAFISPSRGGEPLSW